jgi:hypothetical protein
MKLLVLWVAVTWLVACGGRYEEPGSDGSGTSAPPGSGADSDGGKKSDSSGTSVTLPQQDLGACVPGFERAADPGRSCNWLTEAGVCFDTKDAACNCICPTSADSVCFSSFDDGPGSATLVHCTS